MFEKIKKMLNEKDDKRKMENLVVFLIILVVTLILINKILKDDSTKKEEIFQNQAGVELVSSQEENVVLVENEEKLDLEKKIEEILSKMSGIRESRCFDNISKGKSIKNRRCNSNSRRSSEILKERKTLFQLWKP